MTIKPSQVKELIHQPQDHLELVDSQVVLVAGPNFEPTPIALIAHLKHVESRLQYKQLIKMSPKSAGRLLDRLDQTYNNIDKLSDT